MEEMRRTEDLFVRYLFGKKGNERIFLNFINAVMEDSGFETFETVEILNPFNMLSNTEGKESILDVKAITNNGKVVIIEIQVIGNKSFLHRALYYAAKNYSDLLKEGEDYRKLKPVISINLVDFDFGLEDNQAHSCYMMKEYKTNKLLTDHIQMHFVELPKCEAVKLLKISLTDKLKSWFSFFKSDKLEEDIKELATINPIMEEVMSKYRTFTADELLMDEIKRREAYELNYNMTMEYERKEGREEGIIEVAYNMKKDGVDINTIIKYSGLSKEEIEKL